MDQFNNPILNLRNQISALERLLTNLKVQLTKAEASYYQTAPVQLDGNGNSQAQGQTFASVQSAGRKGEILVSLADQVELPQEDRTGKSRELHIEEFKRYGRQLILPEIGLRGGLSSPNYDDRLYLTPIGSRTATA